MHTKITPDTVKTKYWHQLPDGRVQCDLCPRYCKLKENQRGFCFIRQNFNQQIVMTSYGRSSGFAIDPIEKKPLNHFLPGSSVFSFGTAGCNLGCKYCQNWDISKSREMDTLMAKAEPSKIAQAAKERGCQSVAYTYNDPVVFHEYAYDTAVLCRELGLKNVAVSAGYVCNKPREEFYSVMDAANIDLKSFSEKFYKEVTGGELVPVLETLIYIKKKTAVWLELTTLIVPGMNDSKKELEQMAQWVVANLGEDVPMHFSAFHPDWKMKDIPATSISSLLMAREIAVKTGVRYAYIGNAHNKEADSTYCHQCGHLLIGRDWYELSEWNLTAAGACNQCHTPCAGVFAAQPGKWGRKRIAVGL